MIMGVVRKATSVATLGIVPFHSRADLLERELDKTQKAHEQEAVARVRAEKRADAATQQLRTSKKKRRKSDVSAVAASVTSAVQEIGQAVSQAVESANVPTVAELVDDAKAAGDELGRRARKAAAKAEAKAAETAKRAEAAAADAAKRAEAAAAKASKSRSKKRRRK